MGTRAIFWIGDPTDLENREWLGCVAFDGYEWLDKTFVNVFTKRQFTRIINRIKQERDDFADPARGGFPFPWTDDVFLTDVTYAFFNRRVNVCWSHDRFMSIREYLKFEKKHKDDEKIPRDPSHYNVPAPTAYWDRSQPDSIIIISR